MYNEYEELDNFMTKIWFGIIVFLFGILPAALTLAGHPVTAVIYYVAMMIIHIIFCNWIGEKMSDYTS